MEVSVLVWRDWVVVERWHYRVETDQGGLVNTGAQSSEGGRERRKSVCASAGISRRFAWLLGNYVQRYP